MIEGCCPYCLGTGRRPYHYSANGIVQVEQECAACRGTGIDPRNMDPLFKNPLKETRNENENEKQNMNETNTPVIDQEELEKSVDPDSYWFTADKTREHVKAYTEQRKNLAIRLLVNAEVFDEMLAKAMIGVREHTVDLQELNEQTEELDLHHALTQDSKCLVRLLDNLGFQIDIINQGDRKQLRISW